MMNVEVLAYAKLNVSLRVLGLRADGYHELRSDVQTIELADRLTIALTGEGVRVDTDIAVSGENLAARAAAALLRRKALDRGVRIRIAKTIPVGAGLGGGSSDGAAVLRVLDRLTPPELSLAALCEVGAEVGSDMPLFLYGGRVRIAGRGERVERLPRGPMTWFVVVVPPIHCATKEIYARWDALAAERLALRRGDPLPGENDLLEAALDVHPALVPYHRAMQSLGADFHGMSGSGSSFYAAFATRAAAERARGALAEAFGTAIAFVCRSTEAGHCVVEGP